MRARKGRLAGVGPRTSSFTSRELEVVDRFATTVAEGRYGSAQAASVDCVAELQELRRKDPALRERTRNGAERAIGEWMRARGLKRTGPAWTPVENAMLREAIEDVVEGRSSCARHAAFGLLERFRDELGISRPFGHAHRRLVQELEQRGLSLQRNPWTRRETEILGRHFRTMLRDGGRTFVEVGALCARALGGRRTEGAVIIKLYRLARQSGHPMPRCPYRDWERRIIERHTRRAAAGRSRRPWQDAARACLPELRREASRRGEPIVRTEKAVANVIGRTALALGLSVPAAKPWTPVEEKVLTSLLERYRREGRGKARSRTKVAESVRVELKKLGIERTLKACMCRVDRRLAR